MRALIAVIFCLSIGCGEPVAGDDASCHVDDASISDASMREVFVAPEVANALEVASVCDAHGGDPITDPSLLGAAIAACDSDDQHEFCWVYSGDDLEPQGRPLIRTSSGTMYAVIGDALGGRPACAAR